MWDSFRNKKSLIPNIECFDSCFTFDPDDAQLYGMTFRPLFFSPGFAREPMQDFEYQYSFIGTAHSDRYRIVSQITSGLGELERCYVYFYLQAPWVYWAHKIGNRAFRGAKNKDFNYSSLSHAEVQGVFFSSKAVIDIEHPAQTGLTMRTFETLGANKKLITTNWRVRDYDFFNPQNILVIDRNDVARIPHSFFAEPYMPISSSLYGKYSIQGWLDEVIAS
jgi:spore maturation protein CgeB